MPASRTVPLTRTFDGPACRLSARDWGGDGLPILLLHGMSGNTHWWDEVAPRLPGLRPIALDLRGHGESGWARDLADYRIESFPDDVEAARREFGLSDFAIAAHSFGARVALEYAAKRPAGLKRLAVLDFLCEVPPGGLDRFTRARAQMQPVYDDPELILDRFRFHPPGTLRSREDVREFGRHCVKRTEDGRWTWRFDWRAFTLRYLPVWPLLASIDVPVLVMRGERSTTMPREHWERFRAHLPQARAVEVPKAFHHLIVDLPGPCAQTLDAFFLGRSPSEPGGKLLE